jgi:putative ABC transport system permease protein
MRIYKLLLRLYPKSFRNEYGDELCRIFARRRRDASGPFAVGLMWLGAVGDTLVNAARVHFDILRQDLRHTSRTLRRTPGFTVTAVLVTALGVGATTAAFTLADHVLLRPLPFPEPDQLVKIWEGQTARPASMRGLQGTNDVSPPNYLDWKAMSSSFSVMGAYAFVSSNLVGGGDPLRLEGVNASADTMKTIGVPPAMGRWFTDAEDTAGAPCTVLISDGLWRQRFGAEASILGRSIVLDDETCTVVGVMPRGFEFPTRTIRFWRAMRFRADVRDDRQDTYLRVIARRKPGVSQEQASADLASASATLSKMYPKDNAEIAAVIIQLRDELSSQSRMLLFALAGASLCVLLIACTNLASLLVARATVRVREMAVRTAMGAGRERLVRQMLTESLLIALIGGGLGLLVAIAAVPMAVKLVPTALPIAEVPAMDLRMLAMAAIVTLGTGIGFGVLPAFRAVRQAASAGLREGARAGSSRRAEQLRSGLVVAQVGASVVLLVCAGLLIRALVRVQSTDPGFNSRGVLSMRTTLPWGKYGPQATRGQFYRQVLEQVNALPGVKGAAFTSFLPMTFRGGIWGVTVPGRPQTEGGDAASARFVTPEYFRVMEIPLKLGRALTEADSAEAQPTAVVSEEFVRKYLDGRAPIGQRFNFSLAGDRTIVGVVGEVRVRGLERQSEPQVYLPYQQQGDNRTMNYSPKDLVVRLDSLSDREETDLNDEQAGLLTASIRRIITSVDPGQPISDVQPLSAIVEGETTARAVQVQVLGAFAAVACVLAAIGLHGLLAFVVSARRREFGVRLALGAEPRAILGMVARRGARLALVGIVVGAGLAYLAGRWMQSLLFGLDPADLTTLGIAIGVSLTMALAGSLMPALRAARTNPTEAIRAE